MKGSKLVILIGLVLILGAAFYFTSLKPELKTSEKGTSELLFSDVDAGAIRHITMTDGVDTVSLTLKDGKWTVDEKWSYPAQFKKIHELVYDILQIRPSQIVTNNEEHYERLGVKIPPADKEGTVVTFLGKDDQKEVEIMLGKMRKSKNNVDSGQYVRLADKKDVFLISNEIRFSLDIKSWLAHNLMDVQEKDVKSVTINHVQESNNVSLSREKKDAEFELASVPDDKKLKKSDVKALAGELSNFVFDDVYPADSEIVKDLSFDTTYRSVQFNGLIYELAIAEKDEKLYTKITLDYKELQRQEELQEKSTEESKGEKSEEERKKVEQKKAQEKLKKEEEKKKLMIRVEEDKKLFSQWVYELSSFRKDRLMKKASDLWEDKKDEVSLDEDKENNPILDESAVDELNIDKSMEGVHP